jgi:hypothetical protein
VGQPTGEQVTAARDDMTKDSKFWYESSDIVLEALRTSMQLGLGGFEFGKLAVDRGMLDSYNQIQEYVIARLGEGVTATEDLGRALADALDDYDRADQNAAQGIGNAGGN